jgi:hypothetical protein
MWKPVNSNPPGCLSFNAIVAVMVAALIVAAVGIWRGGMLFSPGQLNAQAGAVVLGGVKSHAQITRCAQCHTAPWGGLTMADQCLACHTDLKQDPKNFHNVMITQGKSQGCYHCHPDHRGANALLINQDLGQFPHNLLGYSLKAHQQTADGLPFKCADCHAVSYIGFDQAVCAACHARLNAAFMQDHAAMFGQDCRACHDGLDTYGHAFNHQQTAFVLSGQHTALLCSQCHAGARSLADLKAAAQDCYACHAKDDHHNGQFSQDCGICHTPAGWVPSKVDHSKTAFALLGKHQAVQCSQCHVNGIFKGTSSVCSACHAEPDYHKGLFGTECATCHTANGWSPAQFNEAHTFPINHGRANTCRSCHPDNLKSYTCFSCHNQSEIVNKHREERITDISNCVRCHANGRGGEGGGNGG